MNTDPPLFEETALDMAIRLQHGLIAYAIDGGFDGGDDAYNRMLT